MDTPPKPAPPPAAKVWRKLTTKTRLARLLDPVKFGGFKEQNDERQKFLDDVAKAENEHGIKFSDKDLVKYLNEAVTTPTKDNLDKLYTFVLNKHDKSGTSYFKKRKIDAGPLVATVPTYPARASPR